MIEQINYTSTLPTTDNATPLTKRSSDLSRSKFSDLSQGQNTPLDVELAHEERSNIVRHTVTVRQKLVDVNSNLNIETPHMIQAQFSITADKRYATYAQMDAALTTLVTVLLDKEGSSDEVAKRVLRGEL